jgi:aspartyl/asparaginyl beta-hydroxylase (cupin superfamily)
MSGKNVKRIQELGFYLTTLAETLWPIPIKLTTINISIRDLLITLLIFTLLNMLGAWGYIIFLLACYKEPALLCFPYNVMHSLLFFTPRFWTYGVVEPKLNLLLQNFSKIQQEALGVIDSAVDFSSHPHQRRIALGQPWKVFSFFSYGTINYENCARCPVLSSLLLQIPTIKLAMLSCMDGPTHIRTHCGYFKNILRVHLTLYLEYPETTDHKRFIRVGDEEYHWTLGDLVVFDDTYPHEVKSSVPGKRIVLFLDVERPYINSVMKKVSSFFLTLLSSSPNLKAAAQFQEKNTVESNL